MKLNPEKFLEVSQVNKYYHGPLGSKIKVLEDINFSIADADDEKIISILAPFGSGKTSLTKIVSALDNSHDGDVLLKNKKYTSPDGSIIFIPEKPASFPWFDVRKNIEFIQKNSVVENSSNINEIISAVGLTGYENHHSHSESYGFRFRISLARALVVNPKIIIIDDSFKIMEHITRKEIYDLILETSKKNKTKFLITTTDVSEAIILSDKIFFMNKKPGRIFNELIIGNELKSKEGNEKKERIRHIKNEIVKVFETEKIANDLSLSI